MTLKPYIRLVKPGIILGNLITAIAGYFFASSFHPKLLSLSGLIIGLSLIIASACCVNNLFDREIDAKMERTKTRPSVTGEVTIVKGIILAVLLLIAGTIIMATLTNLISTIAGLIGFAVYSFMYTPLKPISSLAIFVGSIAGAVPIVAGYLAFSGQYRAAALILGLIMVAWQMPHFHSIAIYRKKEYMAASIPILPATAGTRVTLYYMVGYSAMFAALIFILHWYSPAGFIYLSIMGTISLAWLMFNIYGLFVKEVELWARRNFLCSLVIVMLMSLVIAFR